MKYLPQRQNQRTCRMKTFPGSSLDTRKTGCPALVIKAGLVMTKTKHRKTKAKERGHDGGPEKRPKPSFDLWWAF